MDFRSIRHPGLRRLIEDDDESRVAPDLVVRVRGRLAVLRLASDIESLIASAPPGWRVHPLSGDRHGTWSLRVSANWRMTFEVEGEDVVHLHLEDYH